MIEYYTEFWTEALDFQGRARRSAYWYAWLMNIIVITILSVLKAFVPLLTFLYSLYGLAMLIPQLSLSIRRLHDTGRSGFWLLLGLLPAGIISLLIKFGGYSVIYFIGSHPILVSLIALIPLIILIVFFCQDSNFDNYYGPSPKYHQESEPEDKFYSPSQSASTTGSSFYKKIPEELKEEPKQEKGFYNRDKIEPQKEKSSFYK